MNDDELLRALGRKVRDARADAGERLDERWDALAAGQLSDTERDALLEEAAGSEEAAAAYEAFRPLGAEFHARVVARIQREQAASGAEDGAEMERGAEKAGTDATATAGEVPRSNVVPLQRLGRVKAWIPLAVAAGLAAAVGLPLLLQAPDPALPGYSLDFEGMVAPLRSERPAAEGPARLVPGNTLRLVLTPQRRVEGELTAQLYSVSDDTVRRLDVPVRLSADGAALIEAVIGRNVALPAGQSALLVVLGRTGKLPSPQQALAAAASGEVPDDWAAWRLPVELAAEGE